MGSFNYRTFQDLAVCIRNGLRNIPHDWDLIVGIPRSGMIPAYMIGLMLNRPVCSIDEFIHGIQPSNGERKLNSINTSAVKRVLMVDDSVHSGVAQRKAKQRISNCDTSEYEIKWLAIYAREEAKNIPDYYFEILPAPRAFEWNYLNSNIISRSCFDIDGVLCVDPTNEENDDGPKYINFLKNAKPLFIPKVKIHTIVTSRLEKYRPETEEWLRNNHVEYNNLVMLDLPSKEDRIRLKAHATFKAQIYGSLKDTCAFYESDRNQALQIASITKKPCFCVETDELFYGYENSPILSDVSKKITSIKGVKVLLYSHELTYTGAPHSLLRICNILLKNGCFVEVWSPLDGPFKEEFEKLNIIVRIVENPALRSPKYLKMIASFDVAIANTVLSHRFYLAASKLIPTIWFIREALNLPSMVDGVPERRQALMQAPLLYCVSEFAQNFINSHYNHNTKVIHNCVEDYYTGSDNNVNLDKVNFAVVGNVKYNKGFDLAVDAFNSLPKDVQNRAHLYLVGRLPDNDKDYWSKILAQANDNPNISYVGEITDTERKFEFYRTIDVFVIASRSESCSLVALEAAMLGKPIILNQHVGAKYIVTPESGWIIQPDSVQELEKAIQTAVDNAKQLEIMGCNSRKNYLRTSTIDRYEKAIVGMIIENLPATYNDSSPLNQALSNASLAQQNMIQILQQELNSVYSSWPYKIGQVIMFIPKKVRGGIRCYQENGFRYTVNRIKEKFFNLFRNK